MKRRSAFAALILFTVHLLAAETDSTPGVRRRLAGVSER